MVSTRKIIKTVGAAALALLLIFLDKVLSWYIGLTPTLTWSVSGVIYVLLACLVIVIRRWPLRFLPYRDAIKDGLAQIRFGLMAFVFLGNAEVWYKVDLVLWPFYMYWGTWVVFGLQALLFDSILSIEYPQLNVFYRLTKFVWMRIRRRILRIP